MIVRHPRSLAFALLITTLPMGFALAAGSGGGGLGAGVGAAGTGSAAVGGGAPAGAVGGGPPAGRVGGGSPGSGDPAGNGAAGTGDPSANAGGVPGRAPIAPPGVTSSPTTGGYIGGLGVGPPPAGTPGGAAPAAANSHAKSSNSPAPNSVQRAAEDAPFSSTGRARPGPDGVSTMIVAARACGVAAHETDGTTTCVGIPGNHTKPHRNSR